MLVFSKVFGLVRQCVSLTILTIVFAFCKSDQSEILVAPPAIWRNTFTPILGMINNRDTVYDDEYVSFHTDFATSDRYIWSWGDGTKTDTTKEFYCSHLFKGEGYKTVQVRIERGLTYGENKFKLWVKHRNTPSCGFRLVSDDSLYVENPSPFLAIVNTSPCLINCGFAYYWDFGDGNIGSGYNPKVSYSKPGEYLVQVRISRCEAADTVLQKKVVVVGNAPITPYACSCLSINNSTIFLDTIDIQNLPHNPIKVDGRVLRRNGESHRYYGEFNCIPNQCDTYTLDVSDNLDSVQYKVTLPYVLYNCVGKRL